ncbi:MAG: hypothetical protein ACK5Z5_06285 [Neisseriaceae bacterium]
MANYKYSIKELKWQVEGDKLLLSELKWLPWVYYITQINDKFEVVVVDKNVDYIGDYELYTICNSLADAQLKAGKHYTKAINRIIKENVILY